MASRLVSELQFGSYFVYSPRGTSDVSRRSRRVRSAVKSGDVQTIRTMVEHVATNLESSGLAAVLGGDVTLVPCPRSSPLVDGALWPGRIIAEELVRVGLGREVSALLWRTEAVPKSAFAVAGKRPDAVRHYETIEAVVDLAVSGCLTLVDDIVTKGNTLLGAASRLAERYPGCTIGAFALVRTLGLQPEVAQMVEPCLGCIRERYGEAQREP